MRTLLFILVVLVLLGLVLKAIEATFFFFVSSPWIPILALIPVGYIVWDKCKKNPQTYSPSFEGLSIFRRQKPLLFWSGAAFAILLIVSVLPGDRLAASSSGSAPSYDSYRPPGRSSSLEPSCQSNLEQLNSILLVMNSKIMAMPPIATIYSATSQVYRDAIAARDGGNFEECVRLTDIAIRHSEGYAR